MAFYHYWMLSPERIAEIEEQERIINNRARRGAEEILRQFKDNPDGYPNGIACSKKEGYYVVVGRKIILPDGRVFHPQLEERGLGKAVIYFEKEVVI